MNGNARDEDNAAFLRTFTVVIEANPTPLTVVNCVLSLMTLTTKNETRNEKKERKTRYSTTNVQALFW